MLSRIRLKDIFKVFLIIKSNCKRVVSINIKELFWACKYLSIDQKTPQNQSGEPTDFSEWKLKGFKLICLFFPVFSSNHIILWEHCELY